MIFFQQKQIRPFLLQNTFPHFPQRIAWHNVMFFLYASLTAGIFNKCNVVRLGNTSFHFYLYHMEEEYLACLQFYLGRMSCRANSPSLTFMQ